MLRCFDEFIIPFLKKKKKKKNLTILLENSKVNIFKFPEFPVLFTKGNSQKNVEKCKNFDLQKTRRK